MIDGLLRPVITVFIRIRVLAFQSFEWSDGCLCFSGAVETAKDVMMILLTGGVGAMSLATLWLMHSFKDALNIFPTEKSLLY